MAITETTTSKTTETTLSSVTGLMTGDRVSVTVDNVDRDVCGTVVGTEIPGPADETDDVEVDVLRYGVVTEIGLALLRVELSEEREEPLTWLSVLGTVDRGRESRWVQRGLVESLTVVDAGGVRSGEFVSGLSLDSV